MGGVGPNFGVSPENLGVSQKKKDVGGVGRNFGVGGVDP